MTPFDGGGHQGSRKAALFGGMVCLNRVVPGPSICPSQPPLSPPSTIVRGKLTNNPPLDILRHAFWLLDPIGCHLDYCRASEQSTSPLLSLSFLTNSISRYPRQEGALLYCLGYGRGKSNLPVIGTTAPIPHIGDPLRSAKTPRGLTLVSLCR